MNDSTMPAPYYDPITGRCPHGTRRPHECRDGCEDGPPPAPVSAAPLDLDAIEARAKVVDYEARVHGTGQAWTSSYLASAADVPALCARVRELEAERGRHGCGTGHGDTQYPACPGCGDWHKPGGAAAPRIAGLGAIVAAIRVFTVDATDDKPNGKAEAAIDLLSKLLDPKEWSSLNYPDRARLDMANGAAASLCEALADNTKALCVAAEGYFGGDFRKP